MVRPIGVRMTGPLAPHQDAIWTDLVAHGYAFLSAVSLLRVAAHVSRWLEAERLSLRDFTCDRIDAFISHRIDRGYTCWRTARGLEPILRPLRAQGVVPCRELPPADGSAFAELLREYQTFLVDERGVTSGTAVRCLRTARRFFSALGVTDLPTVRRLSAPDVSGFVLRAARSSSVGSTKLVVTDLRSLLRFLHVRGLCGQLAAAVPAVAGHRLTRLPRHIPWNEVDMLLNSCDLGTAVGQRNHAVLLLLVRLGLRAGEVAAIELGDIHWRAGEILVRGKGSHYECLPLPQDVGTAIARYLKGGRPPTTSRKVLLNGRAPFGELRAGTITAIVGQASRRAGTPRRSAHQLRHTAATQMLRGGASLQAIADVLRHRALDTTAIYAKVDHLALRPLARPWLGGGA